uniref:RAB3C, member RAS oncogene family n=1 Tax=Meleagris gallopavo TaxID=9103 RepID=A0A803XL96_MELGA
LALYNFDYMFKLLIIGNSSVGKTSFLFRYADDSFTSAFVTSCRNLMWLSTECYNLYTICICGRVMK